MKTRTLLPACIFLLCSVLFISWKTWERPKAKGYGKLPNTPVALCGGVSWDLADTLLAQPRLLSGLGDLHYPVTTTSLEAQKFFEQGLRLVYAFNHWEAIQSFREATRLDPECAMAYWGLALAYGPNLNDVNPKDRERIALDAIQQAQKRKARISQVEKDMIDALATRYNGKAYEVRDSLNQVYAGAMGNIAQRYPEDAEVQILYADAVMNTMPWDYWLPDGKAKLQTQEAKRVLESTLAKFPRHPGAHHLYIHLIEASPTPELGLNSAKFLEAAMPGAGHIVHMPSHIYVRTGDYTRAVLSNVKAAEVDEKYLARSENQGMYRLMYYPHNIDFICFSSYMEGRSNLGIQSALKLAYKSNFMLSTSPGFSQYMQIEPMIAFTRFGKWNDILALPDPGKEPYPQVMWRFSRGMALLRTGFALEAKYELSKLDSLAKLDALKSMYISFNPVSTAAGIAADLLHGEIALKEKKFDEAISFFQKAVKTEDGMRYNEPPDWKIPTRHFLGAALLEAGKFAEAEQVYNEDLKRNRENGWSLAGLHRAQHEQGKKDAVLSTVKRFSTSWKNADITIITSRF
ncbi:tetratricopeptide repeat protein [Chryseolinea soli]|uniref:Tetratricopeptide repeat protein n=1 Tax=Chryseolinea soli TaxID=2321403 RepID=A0A385SLE3_9BACT|nr:hypothetical protein [Chryseolinea soli]AYB31774.1 hypothetical protein D4L85_14900 [Chryseolinea soli]